MATKYEEHSPGGVDLAQRVEELAELGGHGRHDERAGPDEAWGLLGVAFRSLGLAGEEGNESVTKSFKDFSRSAKLTRF